VNQPAGLDWSFPGLAAGGHGAFQFDRPTHVSRLNQCFARGHGGNGIPAALVQGPPQTGWTWWGSLATGPASDAAVVTDSVRVLSVSGLLV
jgi:hypothetical protein